MHSETIQNKNKIIDPNQLRGLVGRIAALGAVVTTFIAGGHLINEHNHIKSADTMEAIKAEVGHVPAGIKAIKRTKTPDIVEVQYVVQPEADKIFVSSVAADMHPIAPNQDPQSEFSAIKTYTGSDNLNPGEEIDMLVNTDQGQILPKQVNSAEATG